MANRKVELADGKANRAKAQPVTNIEERKTSEHGDLVGCRVKEWEMARSDAGRKDLVGRKLVLA